MHTCLSACSSFDLLGQKISYSVDEIFLFLKQGSLNKGILAADFLIPVGIPEYPVITVP